MIDEKKLLENVVEMFHCVPLISNGKREEYFDDILERQPKIEQPQLNQWHVVADGYLPKEEGHYLVSLKHSEFDSEDVDIFHYDNEDGFMYHDEMQKTYWYVIAWMELPKPYKERD